jgi:hypothetical protein
MTSIMKTTAQRRRPMMIFDCAVGHPTQIQIERSTYRH